MRYKVLRGKEIQKIRERELQITLVELGRLADITPRTLRGYELEKTRPKGWFLKRLNEIRQEFKAKPILIQLHHFTGGCKKRLALIAARIRQNKTQRDVAQMLGVDFSLISKWETGRLTPLMCWIHKLAELYRVAKEILFPDVFGQKETTFAEAA